jgi:hypothetical protein
MWRKRPPNITEGSEVAIYRPRKDDAGVWTVLGQVPTKGYGSSWIFEPCLTCVNALRRVHNPGFSLGNSDPRDPAYALVREPDGLRKISRRSRLIVLRAGLGQ